MKTKKSFCFSVLFTVLLSVAPSDSALRVCDMTELPPSINPYVNIDGKVSYLLRHFIGPWIDRDSSHNLIPGIFLKWESTRPTEWRFVIQKGLKFNNGEPLEIADVLFSIESVLKPDSALANEFSSIKTVRPDGADAIIVETKAPDPILPARFANRPFLVNKAEYERLGGTAYYKKPLGVWAYRFKSMDAESIVLEKTPGFSTKSTGMDTIVYIFIKDDIKRFEAISRGDIDILTELRPTMSLEVAKNPGLELAKVPASQYVALFLNALPSQNGIFQNRNLRMALAYGVNSERLILTTLNGNGLRMASITVPQEFGFNQDIKPRSADPSLFRKHFEAFLDEAKMKKPLKLRVAVVDYLENSLMTVKAQLAPLGIDIEILSLPRGKILMDVIIKKDVKVDAYVVDPTDPYLDASFQLNLENNPSYPSCFFSTPEIKQAIDKANVEMNQGLRASFLKEAQSLIYSEFGSVPLYQKILLYALSKKVVNFKPSADTYLRLENVRKE